MGRDQHGPKSMGRDRPDSNSPVKNMASAACGASKLQQMLKVLAGRPGFDRAVRQVSRRYPVVADNIICAKVPSDGVTLMGFDTLLQISLVIEIQIFQTSVHLSNSPFLLTT